MEKEIEVPKIDIQVPEIQEENMKKWYVMLYFENTRTEFDNIKEAYKFAFNYQGTLFEIAEDGEEKIIADFDSF